MAIIIIPTRYGGRFFRSRLEARWARFFDSMGIRYNYEPEGLRLSNGTCYLPDFYLPEYNWFCEVKPTIRMFRREAKGFLLAKEHASVMLLDGEPDYHEYIGFGSFNLEGSLVFDCGGAFSLDVDWYNTRAEGRFWTEPDYTEHDQIDPIGRFSTRYMTAVTDALSERFEAA